MRPASALALGFLSILVLLELGLRLVGAAHHAPGGGPAPSRGSTILCLGNSFTEGVGAPPGQSYCDHLQRLIERAGLKYRVVNRGRAFTNSYHVLMAIKRELEVGEPEHPEASKIHTPTAAGLRRKLQCLRRKRTQE